MAERVLTRVHSLRERLDETLITQRNEILALLSKYFIQILCFHIIIIIFLFSFAGSWFGKC